MARHLLNRIAVTIGVAIFPLLSVMGQAQTVIDSDGNIYAAVKGSAVVTKRSAGTEMYQVNLGRSANDAVLALALGPDGSLYAAGAMARRGFVTRLNASGEQTGSVQLDASVGAIAVNGAGALFAAGDRYVMKLDAQFKPLYKIRSPGHVAAIAATASGVLFAAINESIYRLSPDGSTWTEGLSLGRGTSTVAITTDAAGAAYITGTTTSLDFPMAQAAQQRLNGPSDAFAAKLNAEGTALEWSTYLGGLGDDVGNAIAVDSHGNLSIAGFTTSPDLPGVGDGTSWHGGEDGFVTQMDAQGRILKTTYLGSAGNDRVVAMALDASGQARVSGWSDQGGIQEWSVIPSQPAVPETASLPVHRAASSSGPRLAGGSLGLPGGLTIGSSAGSYSVVMTTTGPWTAAANDSFLHISAGSASGTGSSLVLFTADAFAGTGTRVGTLTIAGSTLTVTQVGTNYAAVSSITTLVSSGLNAPAGLAVDQSGNVYFADYANNAIKKWSSSTQQVTTLVTTGVGNINPYGVALDSAGNIYFSIPNNNTIQKWNASTQQVTTLVSTGLNSPRGVAVDGSGNIYIADSHNNSIKVWTASSQLVTTLVATGANTPDGVAVDGSANVYYTDSSGAVKKWTAATQQVTTLLTLWIESYSVAVDGAGNVYLVDANNTVMKWTAATQQLTTLASLGVSGSSSVNTPYGAAWDASGNVYIADLSNKAVKKLNISFEALGASALTVGNAAGSGSVSVGFLPSNSTATWTASTATSWLHITAGSTSGAGGAVIQFTYDVNSSGSSRNGTITLDSGLALTVTQLATGVTFAISGQVTVGGAALPGVTITLAGGPGGTTTTNGTGNYSFSGLPSGSNYTVTPTLAGYSFTPLSTAFTSLGANQTANFSGSVIHNPTVVSLSPVISSGANQVYTFQFADTAGVSDLAVLNVLINSALDGRVACYLAYAVQSNTLLLVNDAGAAGGPFAGGMVLNGTGSINNSQCTVTGAGSSASTSGNTLTLILNMSFSTAFGGNQVVYMAARDSVNNSGWQVMGMHGVPPLPATFPLPGGMSPSSGSTANPTLTFTFNDATNANNLQTGWALFNTAIDGRAACYLAYFRPANQVYLYPDNGDGSQATNIVLTGTNTISNSQCTISAQGSSVTTNGAQLTVNLNITFNHSFAGPKGVWMADQTMGGAQTSAWQALGAWVVP